MFLETSLLWKSWRKCCSALGTGFYIITSPLHRNVAAVWTVLVIIIFSVLLLWSCSTFSYSFGFSKNTCIYVLMECSRFEKLQYPEQVLRCVPCVIAKSIFRTSVWVCTCTMMCVYSSRLHVYSEPRLQRTDIRSSWGFVLSKFIVQLLYHSPVRKARSRKIYCIFDSNAYKVSIAILNHRGHHLLKEGW